MSWIAYLPLGAAAACLPVAVWAVLVEPRRFAVRRVRIGTQGLGLPRLRVLHLSDTHFHGRDGATLAFLRRLAADGAYDFVFLTGDLIQCPAGIPSVSAALALFRPRLGTYAVLGGHDYLVIGAGFSYRYLLTGRAMLDRCPRNATAGLVRTLEAAGARVLSDSAATVRRGGVRLDLVGLRDAYAFEPDCEAAWRGLDGDCPTFVLAHSPDVLPQVAERGADVAFFGHTHGGQVRLPLVGAVVTRMRLPRRLARGAFRHGRTQFVVNAGLGAAPHTPYRLLCRPEAVIVELDPSSAPDLPDAGLGA